MPRYITTTSRDGIAHVRLARPDKLNALTLDMLDDWPRPPTDSPLTVGSVRSFSRARATPSAPASTSAPR
ncbi:hypothetical protein LP422_19590 [Janibacter limosus]|uniref:Uncharacterized protein n=1 Tax=Janibacter limosus TaxID=53458 RepID=A0AC61U3G7_9MICO|nr:hypothetical protein [Janibacter limosus]UUZ44546.1 hypothetical protein LP422_19590 [Janibacter limosus]